MPGSEKHREPSTMPLTVQIVKNGDDRKPTVVTTLLSPPCKKLKPDNDSQPKEASPARLRWFLVWERFAEYTTLHGFRQIAEESEFMCRRVTWIFLTIFAFGLLLYQMGNSIQLYLSRPVAFNVKRNYYDRLHFPAITICNQNVFRITQAWEKHLYVFLERMFDQEKQNSMFNGGVDEPLTLVLEKLKHRKEDLIISCTWNRIYRCQPVNFSDTLVENSYCYTFNGNPLDMQKTSLTGSDTGLNILMNIEQYEFMRTRSLTAGIQVFVHHQGELPREAISVPPGMKAYIRVNTKQVQLLGNPYGVCGSRPLRYYRGYSTNKCLMECREEWLQQQCGCLSGILPDQENATVATCSLRNYSSCVLPRLADFTPTLGNCNCPTHCRFRQYNSFISFAQISTFDVDQALGKLPLGTRKKMITAREVFYQVNADKRYQAVNKTLAPFANVTNLIHDNLKLLTVNVRRIQGDVKRMGDDLYHRFSFHKYMLKRVVYAMKNNWVRGWDIVRERTLQMVSFDYIPLVYTMELFEESFRNESLSPDILDRYRTILDARLFEKVKVTERALQNMSKIHDGFSNTVRLLTYKITPGRYYDYDFAPKSIILQNKKSEAKFYKKLVRYLTALNTYFREMRRILQATRGVKGAINETEFHYFKYRIEKRSRSFNYYMFLYEDRVVRRSLTIAQSCEKNFEMAHEMMLVSLSKLNYTLNNLLSILENLDEQYHKSGGVIVDLARKYIRQTSSLRYNLTTLSSLIINGQAGKLLESFVSSVNGIAMYKVTVDQDMWMLLRSLSNTVKLVWEKALSRPYQRFSRDLRSLCLLNATAGRDLTVTEAQLRAAGTDANVSTVNKMKRSVFEMVKNSDETTDDCSHMMQATNADWILQGTKPVLRDFKEKFQELSNVKFLIMNVTDFRDELLVREIDIKAFAVDFLKGNEISNKFVRDNFVELQIYFEDLVSVDEIQSPAYTMTQLWSDFGGNFGLLLGASVLSVIEIIDFFFMESFGCCCYSQGMISQNGCCHIGRDLKAKHSPRNEYTNVALIHQICRTMLVVDYLIKITLKIALWTCL